MAVSDRRMKHALQRFRSGLPLVFADNLSDPLRKNVAVKGTGLVVVFNRYCRKSHHEYSNNRFFMLFNGAFTVLVSECW